MNIHHRDVTFLRDAKALPQTDEILHRPTLRDRIQRMFRHTALIVSGLLLAITGVVAFVAYAQTKPVTLTIAVGSRDADDVRVIQGLAQHLSREHANIRLKIARTDGPAESADALDRNAADLAVVRRDLVMPKNGQVIAIQRHDLAVLMVPPAQDVPAPPPVATKNASALKARPRPKAAPPKAEAEAEAEAGKKPDAITKVEDLGGKTIGMVGLTPANIAMLQTILGQSGVAPETVKIVRLVPEDLTTQLRSAKFDALFAVGPAGSKLLAEAAAAVSRGKDAPTFLEIGSSEAIQKQKPVYEATEIPAGLFAGARPAEAVETIGVAHYIVAHRSIDEKVAGDFTRWLFAAKQALGGDFPAFSRIEGPDTDKAASIAVHPGALAYLEGEQKTFFDRYSDTLYWGLMLMSFFGSGAAWLTSFARTSGSSSDRNDLEALIGMVGRARTCADPLDLDILRAEIDAIVARTIRQMAAGKLDQNRSAALKLAAEQARHAIAERQTALAAPDAGPMQTHALARVV